MYYSFIINNFQYFELNSKGELHLELFNQEMCLAYKNDKFDLIDCFDKTQIIGKHAIWKYLKVICLFCNYLNTS